MIDDEAGRTIGVKKEEYSIQELQRQSIPYPR
jgi:hypothetical protein